MVISREDYAGYTFGPFRVNTRERLLFRGDEPIPLPPKVMDTLLVLVENSGRLVEKEALMRAVWGPDTFVEEGGLARNISALRKALGDEADDIRYIATVPKRGYRFVADVRSVALPAMPARVPQPLRRRTLLALLVLLAAAIGLLANIFVRPRPANSAVRSIVILPLTYLSPDSEQGYFAAAMTDALRSNLATIRALTVYTGPEGTRMETAAQLAKKLKADAALEGSVAIVGDQVRISVWLTRAVTGEQILSYEAHRILSDVLSLQTDVARAVATEVQVQVSEPERAALARSRRVNPEAFLAYARGRHAWNRRTGLGLEAGMKYFKEAIAADPTYAPAYAGLADALAVAASAPYDTLPPRQVMPEAKRLALRAIELDEDLAEAHTSLAYVYLSYDWDFPAAEAEFRKAIALNPGYATAHHWYAHYLIATGRLEDAATEMRLAQEREPQSQIIATGLGWCYYHMGQHDKAIELYKKVIEIDETYSVAHFTLGLAYIQKSMRTQARASFERAMMLSGAKLLTARLGLAKLDAAEGRRSHARQLLNEILALEASNRAYVPALYVSGLYAMMGDIVQAERWLEKAFQERNEYIVYIRSDPEFRIIRDLPRFASTATAHGLKL